MRKLYSVLKQFYLCCFVLSTTLIIAVSSYAQVTNDWNRIIQYDDGVSYENDYTNWLRTTLVAIAKDDAGNVYVAGDVIGNNNNQIEVTKYSPGGAQLWARAYNTGTSNIEFHAVGVAVTGSGNRVYVIGYKTTSGSSISYEDIILKFVPSSDDDPGSLGVHSSGFKPSDIALDPDGNVYITGTRRVESPTVHTVMYTKKFNADLDFQWARPYSNVDFSSAGNAIAVTASNVYVTGYGGEDNSNERHMLTVKYNAVSGVEEETIGYEGTANYRNEAFDIALDAASNVYITGYSTEGTPGSFGTYNQLYTTIKYNSNLQQQWINTYDGTFDFGTTHDVGRALVVDVSGNICVTGSGISENGQTGIVTIKYNSSSVHQWTKVYDGPAESNDIDTDGLGNIYVTGWGRDDGKDIITFKYNQAGIEQWRIVYTSTNTTNSNLPGSNDIGNDMVVDGSGNVYVTGQSNHAGVTIKYIQCNLSCPENISVNNTPDQCGAIVNYPAATATSVCGTPSYSIASGTFFPVGTTTVTVLSETEESSCTFTVTVIDNQNPTITCPANITVRCAADVPAVNTNSPTAADNCTGVTVTHVGDVISNQTCANQFTITRTYKATDAAGNSTTCSHTITVFDNIPPQITGLSVTPQILWPPNHTMRDITVNYQVSDNCTTPATTISVSSNEPDNGTGDGDTDTDWEIIDNHHVRLRAERAANGNGRIYTITIAVNDGCNGTVSKTIQVMVPHNITGPQTGNPHKIGSTVAFNGVFWDKPGNSHSAKWLIDNSTNVNGVVTAPSGNQNGKVTGSYKFTTAGVYKLQMNITDQTGVTSYANTNNDLDAIVVIYDPNGGYTYGGGWYPSHAGAFKSNLPATGKASYGFTVNYPKNATKPKGETQFEFKVGTFEFNALTFEYLAISNSKAQFKGTGKIIGGQSGIAFTMTVTDCALDGTGIDKIRMKIFNKNTGAIIYDNQPGASDADNPVAAVGANSVIVIQGNNASKAAARTTTQDMITNSQTGDGLEVMVHPNPASRYFNITINSNDQKEKIVLQVFDQYGRSLEIRNNISNGSTVHFGDLYRPGAYYLKVMQGKQHKEIKLIKLSD